MGCSIIKFQKGISEILYSISSQCRSVTHIISAKGNYAVQKLLFNIARSATYGVRW